MDGSTLHGGHTSCISAEELIRYRDGRLTEERMEVVRLHLESCLRCLDNLLHVGDTGEDEPVAVAPDFMTKVNEIARKAWQNGPAGPAKKTSA
jgi:hypothetical protein